MRHDIEDQPVNSERQLVKDPVCGMEVDPATSEYHSERDGETHYFCSGHCQAKFAASVKLEDGGTPVAAGGARQSSPVAAGVAPTRSRRPCGSRFG